MANKIFNPVPGKILISKSLNPVTNNAFFDRSVILLSENDTERRTIVGFILNKQTSVPVCELIKDFPDQDSMVYFGGPEYTDELSILHTAGTKLEGSREIAKHIYWGANLQQLMDKLRKKEIKGNQIRCLVGYSIWNPEELKKEFEQKAWAIRNCSKKFAFREDFVTMWGRALYRARIKDRIMSHFPYDPSLN